MPSQNLCIDTHLSKCYIQVTGFYSENVGLAKLNIKLDTWPKLNNYLTTYNWGNWELLPKIVKFKLFLFVSGEYRYKWMYLYGKRRRIVITRGRASSSICSNTFLPKKYKYSFAPKNIVFKKNQIRQIRTADISG